MVSAADIKINRRPVGEQVTDILRRMVLTGELEPGQRLVGKHLAEKIGTSRTPVREALHRLAQENLLERRATGGYAVRPMSVREVEEVTGVRAVLESYAVELAARRLDAKLYARLEQQVERFAKSLLKQDPRGLVEANTTFHETLYEAAGSLVLKKQINELAEVLHRFRLSLLSDPKAARRSLEDHRLILEALGRGDAERAGHLCRVHIQAGGAWILEQMKKQEDNDG